MRVYAGVGLLAFVLGVVPEGRGQNIEVNPQNRTVAVSLSQSLQVDPEVAVVTIGYQNYGPTRNAAYSENIEVSKKILEALTSAGIKQVDIETNTVTLDRADSSEKGWSRDEIKERQYVIDQEWNVRVAPIQAQNVVDVAVAAGANELTGVDWDVSDPSALDAKANSDALDKAKGLAEEMASKFNAKVGQLLYVGNAPENRFTNFDRSGLAGKNGLQTVEVSATRAVPLKIFPQKVRRDVTVYAVFALQ